MGPSCAAEEELAVHSQPKHDTFEGTAALLCAAANAEHAYTGTASTRSSSGAPSSLCHEPQDGADMADAAATARPSSTNSAHTTDCHTSEQAKTASPHAGSDTGSQSQHLPQSDDATMGVGTPEPGACGAHSSGQQNTPNFNAPAAQAPQCSTGQQVSPGEDAGGATSFVLHPMLLPTAAQQQVLHPGHPGRVAAAAAAAAAVPFPPGLLPLAHPGHPQHASMLAAAAAAATPYGPLAGLGGLRGLPPQHALAAQVPMFLHPPGAPNNNRQAAQRHAAAVTAAHHAGTLAAMQAAAAHSAIVLNSLTALHGGVPGVVPAGILPGGPAGIPSALIAAGADGPPPTALTLSHPHGPPPGLLLAHLASQHQSMQHALAGLAGAPLGIRPAGFLHAGPHGLLLPGGRLTTDAMNGFAGRHMALPVQQGVARTTSSGHTGHTRQGGETASVGLRGKRSRSQTHSSVSGELQSPAVAADMEVAAPAQQQQQVDQGHAHASKRVKQEVVARTEDCGGTGCGQSVDVKPTDMGGYVAAEVQLATAPSSKADVKSEAAFSSAPELKAAGGQSGCSTAEPKPETDADQSEEDVLRANEGLSSDDDEALPMGATAPLRQSSLPLIPPNAAGMHAGANLIPVITAVPAAGGVWLPSQYNAVSTCLSPFAPSVIPTPVVTTSSTVVSPGGTSAPPVTVETPPLQACLPTAPSEPHEQQDDCDLHNLITTLTKHRKKRTHKKTSCAPTARLASILCGLGLLTANGSSTLSHNSTRPVHVVDVSQLARAGPPAVQPSVQPMMTPSVGVHTHFHISDPVASSQAAAGYTAFGVLPNCKLQATQRARFVHGSAMAAASMGGVGNKSGRRKATPSRAAV